MGELGRRKGRRETLQLDYNLKKKEGEEVLWLKGEIIISEIAKMNSRPKN